PARVNGVNLGRGPALDTLFCAVQDDEQTWHANAELVDFSPGQEISIEHGITLAPMTGPPPAARPGWPRHVAWKVTFCEDQLGNRYRFLPGKVDADVWRPGEVKPDWITWYEANAPIAPRD